MFDALMQNDRYKKGANLPRDTYPKQILTCRSNTSQRNIPGALQTFKKAQEFLFRLCRPSTRQHFTPKHPDLSDNFHKWPSLHNKKTIWWTNWSPSLGIITSSPSPSPLTYIHVHRHRPKGDCYYSILGGAISNMAAQLVYYMLAVIFGVAFGIPIVRSVLIDHIDWLATCYCSTVVEPHQQDCHTV